MQGAALIVYLGALEEDVLQEVSSAIGLFCLKPATRVDPHADGGGLCEGDVLGSDAQAVWQRGHLGNKRHQEGLMRC